MASGSRFCHTRIMLLAIICCRADAGASCAEPEPGGPPGEPRNTVAVAAEREELELQLRGRASSLLQVRRHTRTLQRNATSMPPDNASNISEQDGLAKGRALAVSPTPVAASLPAFPMTEQPNSSQNISASYHQNSSWGVLEVMVKPRPVSHVEEAHKEVKLLKNHAGSKKGVTEVAAPTSKAQGQLTFAFIFLCVWLIAIAACFLGVARHWWTIEQEESSPENSAKPKAAPEAEHRKEQVAESLAEPKGAPPSSETKPS